MTDTTDQKVDKGVNPEGGSFSTNGSKKAPPSPISREIAEKEVERWLDHKRVKPRKREDNQAQIALLQDAIQDGVITLDKEMNLVHQIQYPAEVEAPVKELKYKPRLRVKDLNEKLKGVKADNADGRVVAYAAALTDQPRGVIEGLDTDDYGITQAIVLFFV